MAAGKDWPSVGDYHDALQFPQKAFRLPELQTCTVETNKLQVPRARAGAFANVYKMMNGSGAYAVRLFKFPNQYRQDRYHAVSEYLDGLKRSGAGPKSLVKFSYEPEGIRVKSEWFPVLTMEWVKGINFGEWVRDQAQKGDAAALAKMAEQWVGLLEELQNAKIAHGDLQHDNVMVVGGEPKLVDYDCLTVPSLYGAEALEYGKPAYQHPKRKEQQLSAALDHFSAWVILIALRALAADLSLYQKYVVRTNNENLLFSEADIHRPDTSVLWKDLLAFKDPDVRDWAARLRESLDRPFDQIPEFTVDPYRALRAAIQARPPDWDAINKLAGQAGRGRALPADCSGPAAEARDRVACRDRMQQAAQANNLRDLLAAYQPALIDDWPACSALAQRARQARDQVAALNDLEPLLKNPGDGKALVAAWARLGAKLAGLPDAARFRQAAESWQNRITAAQQLQAVLGGPAPTERAVADAWQRVVQVGGHPDAEKHRPRGELAGRRAERLDKLRAVPAQPTEDADRQFNSQWDDALFANCREADPFRARVPDVRRRLEALARLKQACDAADRGGPEKAVVVTADALPPGYRYGLQARVEQARDRLGVHDALARAIADRPQSDRRIADAWDRARAAGPPADPTLVARCQLAVRRRDLLRQLEGIGPSLPADQQDEQWARLWDEALLANCADADGLRSRYQESARRRKAWQDLEAAVQNQDIERVPILVANPLLAGYPPLVAQMTVIEELVRKGDQVRRVAALFKDTGPPRQLTAEDLNFLRSNPHLFAPQRGLIEQVLRTRLRDQVKLKPLDPAFMLKPGGRLVTVRWSWADGGLVSHCHIATDPEKFLDTLDQADPDGRSQCRRSDHAKKGGGIDLPVPFGWRHAYVTIWPAIDLGWPAQHGPAELLGPPLHLGPIPLAGGKGAPPLARPQGRTPPRKGWLGGYFSG